MNSRLDNTRTIKRRALFAASVIAVMLISIALVSLVSFSKTQQKLEQVTRQYQPKMLSAMQLTTHFYHGLSVLGNYMIEQNERDMELYRSKVEDIDKTLEELILLTEENQEPEDAMQLASIRELVGRIKGFNVELIKLATDVKLNMPAVGIAADRLEPLSMEMTQALTDLLADVEQQEHAQLAPLANNLLYNWTMVISQVRNFLAFRNDAALSEIELYMAGVTQHINILEQRFKGGYEYQAELLDEFEDSLAEYKVLLSQAIDIHSGRDWRTDSNLMRKRITPTLRELTVELESLVDRQKNRIHASNRELAEQIDTAESTIRISMQIALVVSAIVIFLTLRTRGLLSEIRHHQAHKAQIQHKANHDELTQIPNRAFFHEKFLELVTDPERQSLALLFIDLDGFKAINDNIGHDAGDHILKETANRLRASVHETDIVARLGGDEFVVLLNGLHSRDVAEAIADKICRIVRQKLMFHDQKLQVGCSIGVSILNPQEVGEPAMDHKSLVNLAIKQADQAMYQAKRGGKNRYTVYAG